MSNKLSTIASSLENFVKGYVSLPFFALFIGIFLLSPVNSSAQSEEELQDKVQKLQQKLNETKAELKKAKEKNNAKKTKLEEVQAKLADLEGMTDGISIGPLQIGGAMRVNYTIGDYTNDDGPSRGGDGGNFTLDTFRLNLDFSHENWVGKAEYRWYNSYNFLHTGWFGYNFEDASQVQVGVNRVPFGPGPYGVSKSWMFDQHYYVGLADDMDLGVKYIKPIDNLTLDLGFYVSDEGQWRGDSKDSARYSYDVVNASGNGYEERNQVNMRAIYSFSDWTIPTDLGVSLQYGLLDSKGPQSDGDHYAASLHAVNSWNNWSLASQLTYYDYDVEGKSVTFGAYDYTTPVAAEAWIPAASLSYYYEATQIAWLDSVTPYLEYSTIVKDESDFNDSEMLVLGAAFARNGWYVYTDLAYSNGNDFVGNQSGWQRFGANPDDEWETRFNINFGYYF